MATLGLGFTYPVVLNSSCTPKTMDKCPDNKGVVLFITIESLPTIHFTVHIFIGKISQYHKTNRGLIRTWPKGKHLYKLKPSSHTKQIMYTLVKYNILNHLIAPVTAAKNKTATTRLTYISRSVSVEFRYSQSQAGLSNL